MKDRITEILARAWIECDPNREKNPDEIMKMPGSEYDGKPRWQWFIPRAEEMRDFLSDNGLVIRPK